MSSRAVQIFRAGAAVARRLPEPVADGLARIGGRAAARRDPQRRAQVERNLRRVYGADFGGPELRRAVDGTFVSYARYWAESLRLPGTSPETLDARMTYDGMEHLRAAIDGGKGVILGIPHLGGWEWAGFWVATVLKHPISVVVESLEPTDVFEWFKDLREAFGMHVIPLGPDAGSEVIHALKDNHIVSLLCDRSIDGAGPEVEFFGERTVLPAGPATLALRTGAPLLPTAIYYRERMHHGVLRPPLPMVREGRFREDVARVTQLLAHELEVLIRAAPDQWHLMQPNWPSDPGFKGDVEGEGST